MLFDAWPPWGSFTNDDGDGDDLLIIMALSSTKQDVGLLTRTQIMQEYNALRNRDHCPLGMYIMPSTDSIMVWEAVLFIHKGTNSASPRLLHAYNVLHVL